MSMFLLSKGLFVITHDVSNIVEVLDIVPSISFRFVSSPVYKIFDGKAPTFLYYAFIQKAINFERLVFVTITLHKHQRELL